jgi:tetratricopeptide (TPR) repeat protein
MFFRILVGISFALAAIPAAAQENEGGHSEQAISAVPSNVGDDAQSDASHHAINSDEPVTLLANYGNGGFPIATSVPEAQAFFDNGIELAFAFAHQEAIDAMAEAVRLDPGCAMCLAGHAYTLGPTLNFGKTMEERAEALASAEQALAVAGEGDSAFERGFAEALIERYRQVGDTDVRDLAYADAMARLAARFADHDTLQVLAADARMITEYEPPVMRVAMDLLEPVLARSPDHTGAIHFYIHATEIFGEPGLAEAAADRLAAMNLEASHLVHMPSHTYYWVGRYGEAADANRIAVQLGEHQAMVMNDDDPMAVWGIPYHAHNVIFGLGGAMMADDSRTALMLARPLIERAQSRDEGPYFIQLLMSSAYFAMGRFESPSAVLELEEPILPYLKVAWRYARGEAYAFLGDTQGLAAEREAIPERIDLPAEEEDNRLAAADQMLVIARAVLAGRLAMMEGRFEDAAAHFTEAAETEETEDFSRFTDPPAFWYPVRRDLARALLAAGDERAALREAVATLDIRPRDPVALEIVAQLAR